MRAKSALHLQPPRNKTRPQRRRSPLKLGMGMGLGKLVRPGFGEWRAIQYEIKGTLADSSIRCQQVHQQVIHERGPRGSQAMKSKPRRPLSTLLRKTVVETAGQAGWQGKTKRVLSVSHPRTEGQGFGVWRVKCLGGCGWRILIGGDRRFALAKGTKT